MARAGRKNKYETHVKPYLSKIPEWYITMTESQIAKTLGITERSWINYKNTYPELQQCLVVSKDNLVTQLKETLKKKAEGYWYTETTEEIIENEDGETIKKTTKRKRFAHPDTGAIHLLLKNNDDAWRNEDKPTYELKKEQTAIMRQKAEAAEW